MQHCTDGGSTMASRVCRVTSNNCSIISGDCIMPSLARTHIIYGNGVNSSMMRVQVHGVTGARLP